jgi:hypothetical protein
VNPPADNPREPIPPSTQAPATNLSAAKSPTPLNIASEHPVDPSKLTPEEQMALYEKDLKENDWGHQPC